MTMTELQDMILKDSKIDITKLETDSVEAPYIYARYITLHAIEKAYGKKYEKQMKKLKKDKFAYYRGDAPAEVYRKHPQPLQILKQNVPQYVESDSEVADLQEQIDLQNIKIEMLTEFLKSLYQRTFHIGNAIKFMKFKNGEF